MGMLVGGCMSVLTSKSPTTPYDDDTLLKMIELVQKAKESKGAEEYYTAGATRLLSYFAHWRFLYFHGQRHVRLAKDKTVYDEPERERSILITLLSPLLFLAPEVHLREMEELWTDSIILERVWKSFMSKLLGEWGEIILWSTVMLAVNVAFLAIPAVMFSNTTSGNLASVDQAVILPSSSQIASLLSVAASVESIVIGLLLIRYNRTKQELDPAEASEYLSKNSRGTAGLEPLAIIYSIPWASLMWSMVTFSVALLLFCFVVSNLWTRIFVALISAPMVFFTLWCLWITWEFTNDREVWLRGFRPSIARALQGIRSSALRAVESLRNRPASHAQDVNVHTSTGPQGHDGV